MDIKNLTLTLSGNTGPSPVTSVATLSGRTVYGEVVTASTQVVQSAVGGSISVTPDERQIPSLATSVTLTVAWTNLQANSTITLSGTGFTTFSPGSISVGSNTSSSSAVTAQVSANTGNTKRTLTLEASGTDGNGNPRTDTGSFVQDAADGTMEVRPDGDQISALATGVPFTVVWTNLQANTNITLSGENGLSNINPSSISVGNNTSSSTTVNAQVSSNTGNARRNPTLTASGTDGNGSARTDTGYYVQAATGGTITVTPDGTPLTYMATSATFDVSWTNLKTGTTITLSEGTGITGITPTAITVASSTSSSPVQVVAQVSENTLTTTRNVTLSASGTDGNDTTQSDSGYYVQDRGVESMMKFEPESEPFSHSTTGVTITLNYSYLKGNSVTLTSIYDAVYTVASFSPLGIVPTTSATITADTYNQILQIPIYFSANTTYDIKEYKIHAVGTGTNGTLTDDIIITHLPDTQITVTPDNGEIGYQATSVTFNVEWINVKPGTTISITTGDTNQAIVSSSITPNAITASNAAGSGTVVANVSMNASTTADRDATIKATEQNCFFSDEGKYVQSRSGLTENICASTLYFQITKSGSNTAYVTISDLTVNAAGRTDKITCYQAPSIANINSTTVVASSWDSNMFVGNLGARLSASLTFEIPNGASINGDVVMETGVGNITGTTKGSFGNEYDYSFNLGTVTSGGVDLGAVTVVIPIRY